MAFTPDPEGAWASKPKGHKHHMRIISWTLTGPLKALLSCAFCTKTEVVASNPNLRTLREGFTEESWRRFLILGDERRREMAAQSA